MKKEELLKIQRDKPPFGGFVASDLKDVGQIYASPGPIFEPALPGGGWPVGVGLIICVELFGDAFEPGSKQGWLSIVCARVQYQKAADHTGLALGDDQVGSGHQKHRRAENGTTMS
tara:strand:+ start:261 stop:608 length:348 start_codon:yes stop_codon:yes gene_type:complete